ncbi:MAG: HAMP domain-containing protein [Candidatus Omnitrophota bacterium]
MKRWRRVRFLIAKRFQIRYIALILVFMFAAVVLTGYTVYVTTWVIFGEKLAAVYPQGLLFDIVKKVNAVLLLRLAVLTPLVIFIGLVLSNRIAGPIYHIKKYLQKVSAGNYEGDLRLRKNDELQDMAAEINGLVTQLRSERDRRIEKIEALAKKTVDLEETIKEGKEKGALTQIKAIRDGLGVLKS